MKERTEKQPIDDLFARKLGDMSIKPSTDAYSRLQARMGQGRREEPVVFWRNPVVQRYLAAAACLLLVTLLGWLYLSSDKASVADEDKIASVGSKKSSRQRGLATTKLEEERREATTTDASQTEGKTSRPMEPAIGKATNEEQLAQIKSPVLSSSQGLKNDVRSKAFQQQGDTKDWVKQVESKPVLTQVKPVDSNVQEDAVTKVVNPSAPAISERLATNAEVTQNAERVLVVTISEPKALVTARQAAVTAVEEKSVVAATDKPETKGGNLWSQVKRIKQGEIFARQNKDDDDNGLLNRAYNGLKHNFDKDKSVKQ